jgi:mRNA-degrading endonuclease YafQ of YafQ-DinJ toxin-antitoxin module
VKKFRKISSLPEFKKDIKKLRKKYKTIESDLQNFIKTQLQLFHKLNKDTKGIYQLRNMKTKYPKIYKAKKFACRSLKGTGVQSGIRVIYAYFDKTDEIQLIEIYYKGDKKNENRKRITDYCSTINNNK